MLPVSPFEKAQAAFIQVATSHENVDVTTRPRFAQLQCRITQGLRCLSLIYQSSPPQLLVRGPNPVPEP